MAENVEESAHIVFPTTDDVDQTCDCHDSSSSDSDDEKVAAVAPVVEEKVEAVAPVVEEKVWRLFGRRRSIHDLLGGGRSADIFLWRNKKASCGILASATAAWVFLELLQYHLLTLICHGLILAIAILFLWSNASILIRKAQPRIPEFSISENIAQSIALDLRSDINGILSLLLDAALGRNIRKLFAVVGSLWVISIIGNSCNLLTILYTVTVLLQSLPFIYEKYEDKIDGVGEKAVAKITEQYAVFKAKSLSKMPSGILKLKRQ